MTPQGFQPHHARGVESHAVEVGLPLAFPHPVRGRRGEELADRHPHEAEAVLLQEAVELLAKVDQMDGRAHHPLQHHDEGLWRGVLVVIEELEPIPAVVVLRRDAHVSRVHALVLPLHHELDLVSPPRGQHNMRDAANQALAQ